MEIEINSDTTKLYKQYYSEYRWKGYSKEIARTLALDKLRGI